MAGTWGKHFRITIFGESHGESIGAVLDGLPAGFCPDMDRVAEQMARRAPGKSPNATARREDDRPRILSGMVNGRLTGTPLAFEIRNGDMHSSDYGDELDLIRPGHADLTGHIRYYGCEDHRGGGHFSGRLTAPIVFAGALAAQVLAAQGVCIRARALRIGGVQGDWAAMERAIASARAQGDSVGGVIECEATGLPAGWGAPFFDSAESVLSQLMFSIPAVKGIEFGMGFEMAERMGSQCNDELYYDRGEICQRTNHCGGILGGITTGAPLRFRIAVRPTPSIARPQRTVSLRTGEDAQLCVRGRHDPCIVPRALPVVEAMTAIGLYELYKERVSGTAGR